MVSGNVLVLTCTLLLTALCPGVLSRRGGFGGGGIGRWGGAGRSGGGWGGGWGGAAAHSAGGPHYKAPHVNRGPSAGKMAGAAAAGALGGMVIGHGLGSMSRPGYGHGWYGGYDRYGGGQRNAHVRHGGGGTGFGNETDMEYYTGAASRGQTYSCVLLLATTASFLFGYWGS